MSSLNMSGLAFAVLFLTLSPKAFGLSGVVCGSAVSGSNSIQNVTLNGGKGQLRNQIWMGVNGRSFESSMTWTGQGDSFLLNEWPGAKFVGHKRPHRWSDDRVDGYEATLILPSIGRFKLRCVEF